jgi:adenylate cyclase
MERRLAAILAADVVGYSRLMDEDEQTVLRNLRSCDQEVIETSVARHRGRIVKRMGDGFLVEFASAVDAVECAVAWQKAMREKDYGLAFRIGINIGDIVVEEDDIYGDGVNLAARLEGLAAPGGIVVARNVVNQVKNKVSYGFEDLGEKSLKNIREAVRVYALLLSPAGSTSASLQAGDRLPSESWQQEKPKIAVLPFVNLSGDVEQEYFSDGITEDIITELSRFRSLVVIARNSSFAYKGRTADIKEIAQKLGAHYLLQGSFRRSGDRVRVSAQLVEAAEGNQVWAERYDRDLEDIFDLQDELTHAIVSILPGRVDEAAHQRARRKPTDDLNAYDQVLRGIKLFKYLTRESNAAAQREYQAAVERDPQFARAHALLATSHVWDVFMEWDRPDSLDRAYESCRRALALDDDEAWSQALLGFVLFLRRQDEDAEIHFRKALALNPNDTNVAAFWADVLVYLGRWQEALDWIERACAGDPFHFHPEWYDWWRALALYSARRYDEAIQAIKGLQDLDRWHHAYLAACYGHLGRLEEARATAELFVEIRTRELRERGLEAPANSLTLVQERASRYRKETDRAHFLEGLRLAGLT